MNSFSKQAYASLFNTSRRCFGAAAIVKADGNHKFLHATVNRRTMMLDGLKPSAPVVIGLENTWRHHNDVKLSNHQHIFNGYAGGHTFEEEHHLHDEPFGYEMGDDPFAPQGDEYPWWIIFAGGVAMIHFTHSHFKFDRRKIGEVLYHQRLTAF